MTKKHLNQLWNLAVMRMQEEGVLAGLSRELAENSSLVKLTGGSWHLHTGVAVLTMSHVVAGLTKSLRRFYPDASITVSVCKPASTPSQVKAVAARDTSALLARFTK